MAAIVDVAGNRRLQLSGEEVTRSFNFGQRWNKIRVGVTLGFNGTATFNGAFIMGLCSGTTNTYLSLTTDGFIGTAPITFATVPTWTYTATTGGWYGNSGGSSRVITRIGTTSTDASNTTSRAWGIASAPNNLSQWFITFNRTSWNVIVSACKVPDNAAQAATVIPDYWFYRNLEANTNAASYGTNIDGDTTTAIVWTGGILDSFSFVWLPTTPSVEIGHIGVVRFM